MVAGALLVGALGAQSSREPARVVAQAPAAPAETSQVAAPGRPATPPAGVSPELRRHIRSNYEEDVRASLGNFFNYSGIPRAKAALVVELFVDRDYTNLDLEGTRTKSESDGQREFIDRVASEIGRDLAEQASSLHYGRSFRQQVLAKFAAECARIKDPVAPAAFDRVLLVCMKYDMDVLFMMPPGKDYSAAEYAYDTRNDAQVFAEAGAHLSAAQLTLLKKSLGDRFLPLRGPDGKMRPLPPK